MANEEVELNVSLVLSWQDYGVKEDELQSILNYLLTMHEVQCPALLLSHAWFRMRACDY